VGQGSGNGVSGQAVPPNQIGLENSPMATSPAGDESPDVAVNAGLDAQAHPLLVTSQSMNPQTPLPRGGNTGSSPVESGTEPGAGSVSSAISPIPDLPARAESRSVALVKSDGAPAVTNQVDDQHPGQGIDPAKEAFVTPDTPNPETDSSALPSTANTASFTVDSTGHDNGERTDIGPHGINVSNNERPAALRSESIDAAASHGRPAPGELEHRAVDVLLDTSGIWHRRPAQSDHANPVVMKPYPRFSLIADVVRRSNPPQAGP